MRHEPCILDSHVHFDVGQNPYVSKAKPCLLREQQILQPIYAYVPHVTAYAAVLVF